MEGLGLRFAVGSGEGKVPLDEGSIKGGSAKDAVNARSIPCAEVDPGKYVASFLSGGHGTSFDSASPPLCRD
jgi:hypothetical protein